MEDTINPNDSVWATVALMGHVELAGRLSKSTDWGGLLRLDMPIGDTFTTKFFSPQSVYSIDIVSEPIARAFANRSRQIVAYDAPIITRDQHDAVVSQLQHQSYVQTQRIHELERRLTAVNALPEPKVSGQDDIPDDDSNAL